MIIAEKFIRWSVEKYGRHTVYTDDGTWYDEACNVLKLKHYLHSPLEKSLMERVNQYFKDRIESFDDYYPYIYYPCMQQKGECNPMYITGYNSLFLCILIQQ